VRVLLLEDDSETADALDRGLRHEGYEVCVAGDVQTALGLMSGEPFGAAVLDVMVPGGSGYEVLERLKAWSPATKVMLLTAKASVNDRIEGLDRGADDYLVKPFSFGELLARLRALDRRVAAEPTHLSLGDLELNQVRRVAEVRGQRMELTPTEFGLLAALLRVPGMPVGRRELLREVWGYDFDPTTNVVDVHVTRVRRKLKDAGAGDLIRTVRGRGYAAG
jgi:two-component system OmpR family response regulator